VLEDAEADSEHEAGSREPSPRAGEGRRLGDSSHIGSSSAYQAGRAHLVGDGGSGLASLSPDQHHGTQGGSSLRRSIEIQETEADEGLPGYSVEDTVDYELSGGRMRSVVRSSPGMNDEGVDMDYDGPDTYQSQWGMVQQPPTWGFEQLGGQAGHQPPNSDADDMFADKGSVGSNDSTRVEGNTGSDVDEGFQDTPMWSDANTQDGTGMRSMRESAPPPMDRVTEVKVTAQEADDDDDFPIVEIPPPQ
jgi:hypothetical protein